MTCLHDLVGTSLCLLRNAQRAPSVIGDTEIPGQLRGHIGSISGPFFDHCEVAWHVSGERQASQFVDLSALVVSGIYVDVAIGVRPFVDWVAGKALQGGQ